MKFTDIQRQEARDLVRDLMAMGLDWGLAYSAKHGYTFYRLNLGAWLRDNEESLWEMGIRFGKGATKIAFYYYGEPEWVVKVAYRRDTDPDLVNDGLTQDYCEIEYDVYEAACKAGLDRYLAHTEFLDENCGIKFYIQEYAKNASEEISEKFCNFAIEEYGIEEADFDDVTDYEEALSDRAEGLDDEEMVRAVYGDKEGSRLYEFFYFEQVNDLHEGNYGVTRDGRTVIIDFSGYAG